MARSQEAVSKNMSKIRGKDTSIEQILIVGKRVSLPEEL